MPDVTRLDLDIQPLTAERLPALASLFDEGGDPKWCQCAYFRVRGQFFSKGSVEDHRAVLANAVAAVPADGHAPGLLAYRDATVVGWVSVGPRLDYERLTYSKVLAAIDDRPVWSIVCFVVRRGARGQGVARALLAGAIAYARDHGAMTLEAYPEDVPPGERIPSPNAFKGTLRMFERAGFEVVARRQFNASTPVRPIVRLELAGRRRVPGPLARKPGAQG
jgi:ribosomal protein S18 acetylase RimI-like enzyme